MKDINPHGAAAVIIAGFLNSVGKAKAAVNIMPANIGWMINFMNVIVNGNAKFAPLYGLLKIIPNAKSRTGEAETAIAFKNT